MPKNRGSYFSEKIDRHMVLDIDDMEVHSHIERLGKALSSSVRLQIISLLGKRSMNIVEIAETIAIPVSSAAFHIAALEGARLIVTESQPGIRGSKRVCSSSIEDVMLLLNKTTKGPQEDAVSVNMPIGHYYNCNVRPTCGLANEDGYIEECDNPRAFFSPSRESAQLLWFQQGSIEYRFPNHLIGNRQPSAIAFSLEICSEAPGYRNNWPSDITFSVNGHELLTYTSPGDFGGRRGALTPTWWTNGNTQYGLLKTISVNANGAYLDEKPINGSVKIEALNLNTEPYISFEIAVKPTAKHIGGVNLFGEKFGNHPQNIVMHIAFDH